MDISTFDLTAIDAAFIENPYPTLRALREQSPIHRNPDGSVFLTRHADCLKVYQSRAMLSDKRAEFGRKFGARPLFEHHTTSLVFNDPPYHTTVRKLLAAAFTPRKLKEMEPLIETTVDRLLDRAEDLGAFDLVDAVAAALPTEVISLMLGVPEADRPRLRAFSFAILGALDPAVSEERLAAGDAAVTEFSALLQDLIDHRRQHPEGGGRGEVLEALIFGEHEGRRLTGDELIHNCIFLLNAGHETTTSTVANAVGMLLAHPDQHRRLIEDPGLAAGAVEEALRTESPLQIGNRLAGEAIDLTDGALPKGTYIHTSIAGANRDPAAFPDPDRVDIGRSPNRHLAFITGVHVCLGAALARIEGRITLARLATRFPNLKADGPAQRTGLARFRGYANLPVRI